MNNYLGRLIARSRGDLPTLQPRLPGRFESPQGHDLAQNETTSETATPTSVEATLSPPVTNTLRQFMPDQPAPAIQPSTVAASKPAESPRHIAMPAMPATQTPDMQSPAATHGRSRVTEAPAPSPDDHVASHSMHSDADQMRSAPIRSEQASPATATASTHEITPPSPATSALQPPATLLISPQAYVQRPQVHSTPNTPKAPVLNEHHETVVHVTIGRVDVRATAAPTAKSAPRQESPRRASLDDYLRSTPRR